MEIFLQIKLIFLYGLDLQPIFRDVFPSYIEKYLYLYIIL